MLRGLVACWDLMNCQDAASCSGDTYHREADSVNDVLQESSGLHGSGLKCTASLLHFSMKDVNFVLFGLLLVLFFL